MNPVKHGSGWEHLLEIARLCGIDRAYTWSPAAGCHGIGCEVHKRGVCWAEKVSRRFELDWRPHLIPENLEEPLKLRKSAVVTPVPRGDLFGQKRSDIRLILSIIKRCDRHVFAILTKRPGYATRFGPYPGHVWFGTTVESQEHVWRLDLLRSIDAPKKYCMFEPLYGAIDYDLSWLDLVVVGPQTNPLILPKKEWVWSVMEHSQGVHVFLKSKLKKLGL